MILKTNSEWISLKIQHEIMAVLTIFFISKIKWEKPDYFAEIQWNMLSVPVLTKEQM